MSDDDAPFPTAISQERIDTIVKNAQALMHAEHRICAVCDEVVLYQPAITDYDVDDLPDSFFSTLCPPDGSVVTCPSLDPMLLEQYNVAMFFPRDAVRMGSLLLSKRAIARQMRLFPLPDAQQPRVPVCNVCHRALKVKRKKPQPPMISIKNGLFHGELPDSLKLASRIDIKIVTAAYLGGSTFSILATMLLRECRQS